MVDANVFGTQRVELIGGRVHIMTQRRAHMAAISRISETLQRVRRKTDWIVIQGTLRLDRFNAPDPDLMWLPVPIDTPEHQWPAPVLLIEVSDTTYQKDSGVKLRKYAKFAIRDYWIVNIPAGRIEVYREPINPTGEAADWRYASVEHFHPGQTIALLNRPDIVLPVDELLP